MADVEARRIRATTVHTRQNSLDVATTSGRVYEVGYPDQYGTEFVHQLRKAAVDFDVKKGGAGPVQAILPFLLPVALLGAFWFILARRRRGGPGIGAFGRARARQPATARTTTFADVAGADEAVEELLQITEFVENPGRFHVMGARIPKGVLLYGPPGTEKRSEHGASPASHRRQEPPRHPRPGAAAPGPV